MYLHNCTYAKPDSTRSEAAAAAETATATAAAVLKASPWPTVRQKEARISAVLGIAPSECFQITLEESEERITSYEFKVKIPIGHKVEMRIYVIYDLLLCQSSKNKSIRMLIRLTFFKILNNFIENSILLESAIIQVTCISSDLKKFVLFMF